MLKKMRRTATVTALLLSLLKESCSLFASPCKKLNIQKVRRMSQHESARRYISKIKGIVNPISSPGSCSSRYFTCKIDSIQCFISQSRSLWKSLLKSFFHLPAVPDTSQLAGAVL